MVGAGDWLRIRTWFAVGGCCGLMCGWLPMGQGGCRFCRWMRVAVFRWRISEWVLEECQGQVSGSGCGVGQLRIWDKVLGGGCGLEGSGADRGAGHEEGRLQVRRCEMRGVGQLRIGDVGVVRTCI